MTKKTLFFILFCSILGNVGAKTVLVSDIDDTIKISHIRELSDAARRAFLWDLEFKGMSDFYHLVKDQAIEIIYLTNAKKWLMGKSHTKFLTSNNFPTGKLLLREEDDSSSHKVNRLREIIEEKNPTRLILLGDNGEHDSAFYKQIEEEFPLIEMITFIRAAYPLSGNGEIAENHHAFITPVEVALKLRDRGVLAREDVHDFGQHLIPEILNAEIIRSKISAYFPSWVNCRGHFFDGSGEGMMVRKLSRRINSHCTSI